MLCLCYCRLGWTRAMRLCVPKRLLVLYPTWKTEIESRRSTAGNRHSSQTAFMHNSWETESIISTRNHLQMKNTYYSRNHEPLLDISFSPNHLEHPLTSRHYDNERHCCSWLQRHTGSATRLMLIICLQKRRARIHMGLNWQTSQQTCYLMLKTHHFYCL